MSIHSLVLSPEQSRLIRAVADTIQPNWRQPFLASVADNLTGITQVTDADVVRAIDTARGSFIIDNSDCC